jgi:hypothetical protein
MIPAGAHAGHRTIPAAALSGNLRDKPAAAESLLASIEPDKEGCWHFIEGRPWSFLYSMFSIVPPNPGRQTQTPHPNWVARS